MGCYVLDFQEIDQTEVALAGGKGALLRELSRMKVSASTAWIGRGG
jgi:rifampicin phosphotransferase